MFNPSLLMASWQGNILPQFDSAADFAEGLALVGFENTYGFINRNGQLAIPRR